MITRAGAGWQTILADLALILFMVSISAASTARPGAAPMAPAPVLRAEPAAIFRAVQGGPTLGRWLARQPLDPRQQLTIVARFTPGRGQAASAAALALAKEAAAVGHAARVVLEPAAAADLFATLAFDTPSGGLARPLL